MGAEAAVEAKGLTRSFGATVAVDALDLRIERGEIFGLLGPNGAGKTTTLRMLSTLIRPTSGEGQILGHELVRDAMAIRQRLGVMTERPGLYERLSVEANLKLWAEAHEVADAGRAIAESLEFVGMADRAKTKVAALSKGLKQRAALARAVVHRPELLLLDEPSSGLDPAAAVQVEAMLRELVQRGATVLINTHRLAEAQRLCDRVAILKTSLIAMGSPDELRQRFLGNVVRIRIAGEAPDGLERRLLFAGATRVKADGSHLECRLGDVRRDTPGMVAAIVAAGVGVLEVAAAGDLEQVYLDLVGGTAVEAETALQEAA